MCSFAVCPTCDGAGEVGSGQMSHSVNSATIDPPWELPMQCPTCGGGGYVEGEPELRTLDDIEEEDFDESRTLESNLGAQ